MLMQNVGATNKEHYGMFWYFLEWSIGKYLHSLSLPLRLAPPNVNTFPVSLLSANHNFTIERFSYDFELKTREQNRSNKRTKIERFDWFLKRIQTRVAFGWLSERSGEKIHARELSTNQPILCFAVILQHDWPIEQCLLYLRVFFGGKTKWPCFDLFIHWLLKQLTNTHRNHLSRSYENRSNWAISDCANCWSRAMVDDHGNEEVVAQFVSLFLSGAILPRKLSLIWAFLRRARKSSTLTR